MAGNKIVEGFPDPLYLLAKLLLDPTHRCVTSW